MNSKERFLVALHGGQPDRIPLFDHPFSKKLFKEILGYAPDIYDAPNVIKLAQKVGYDGVSVPFPYKTTSSQSTKSKEDITISQWGTTFQYSGVSWPIGAPVDYPIKTLEDFKNYDPPCISPADVRIIRKQVEIALKMGKERLAILGGVEGPFTPVWMLTGLNLFSVFLHENPKIIKSLVKMVTEYSLAWGKAQIEAGIDAITISDDWGYDTGLFISPKHFRKYILPSFNQLVQTFRKMGVPVLMHNDGNLNQIIDDLVNTGINGYHPIERKARMNIGEIKKKYGNKLCLVGNINSSYTLPYGSPADVEAEVKECIRIAAPGGGYICASDHSIHDAIPVENVMKIIETVKKFGKYPLDSNL